MLYLAEIETTRCSECGFHCSELVRVGKPWLLMFIAAVSLCVTAASLLFRCSKFVSCHSERSLSCDNLTCNVIVEILCRYDKVCLLSIDNIDNLMIYEHDGTLAYAYICDVPNKSLNCNMMLRYWVICTMLLGCMTDEVNTVAEPKTQCHDIGLLRPMCWVGYVYMHHVVRLHDRRGQHCCGAKDAMP